MICQYCDIENEDFAFFCRHCGSPLQSQDCKHKKRDDTLFYRYCGDSLQSQVLRVCPKCEVEHTNDFSFCHKCGCSLANVSRLKTVCTFSTANLLHNVNVIRAEISRHTKIMAIVKANAYGHGIISVSKRLEGHVEALGVASIYEAMELRQAGIKLPITLLEGVSDEKDLYIAAKENFSIVFHYDAQISWLKQIKLPEDLTIDVWLKINTGMGRLGFSLKKATQALQDLSESAFVNKPIGIMSHFACSNDLDNPMNEKQIKAFRDFEKDSIYNRSFCNSAAIKNFNEMHYTIVRPGLALYGVSPIDKEGNKLYQNLKPVMTFQTEILTIQEFTKEDYIGYCPQVPARKVINNNNNNNLLVGIIAVGYSDGYPLSKEKKKTTKIRMYIEMLLLHLFSKEKIEEKRVVLIKGKPCNVIGQVTMDMTAVDLSNCPEARVGDKVTLWGEELPIENVAKFSRMSYSLLTGVDDNRVRFEWTER